MTAGPTHVWFLPSDFMAATVHRRVSVGLRACLALVLAAMVAACSVAAAQETSNADRATANTHRHPWLLARGLQTALKQPVGVAWSKDYPLRAGLDGLSHAHQVAYLLDRRIDPGQGTDINLVDLPLAECLERLATAHGMGYSQVGAVAYFGPRETARKIRTLCALRGNEAGKLPGALRAAAAKKQPLAWPDLVTPRELLDDLATEAGVTIQGGEQIPHDLWGAADLPAIPWTDRLSLILAQFDLTYGWREGHSIELLPIPESVEVERSYPGGTHPSELVERWSKLAPNSRVEVQGSKILVTGLAEDHELISANRTRATNSKRTAARPRKKQPGEKVYTLRVAQAVPLGKLLEELSRKMAFELEMDRELIEAAGISLEQAVRLEVKDATLEELLMEALEPAGLTFERHGDSIEVLPRY
jgi:hypothetical protein